MTGDFRASTSACLDVALSSEIRRSLVKLTALDVDLTGRIAALANNKVLALYDLDREDKAPDFITHKMEAPANAVTAITWNRHHNRRARLASTKGTDIMIWNAEDAAKPAIAILRKHQTAVTDISWSPMQEDTLVTASNSSSSMYIWDVRSTPQNPAQELNNNVVRDFEKNPVKEIDVRAKRARLIQVKFNRKNSHLLASAHGMQVCIWDTRKTRVPVLQFPAHPSAVTSLDWSYESEYDLLTGGGDASVKLWTVVGNTERGSSRISTAQPQRSGYYLQATSTREQPVQKVMFTPFGQGAMTSCRGMWEEEQASQTLQLWSLVPRRRFDLVTAFQVGTARILGSCFRKTSDGSYQVVSLDTADHLRIHNVTSGHQRACGDLPMGDSPAFRDFGSTAGQQMVEALSTKIKMSDLRDDLIPIVWKFSSLQGISSDRMTGQISSKELAQVEAFADRGNFGRVSDMRVDVAKGSLSLTMHATSEATSVPSMSEAAPRPLLLGGEHDPHLLTAAVDGQGLHSNITGATPVSESGPQRFEATARLRVVVNIPPGYHSRGDPAQIELFSAGGSVTNRDPVALNGDDPLNAATLKRLRDGAEDAMRQALKLRQNRVEAGLLKLKHDLAARVRDVVNKAAGVVSGRVDDEQLSILQVGLGGNARSALVIKLDSWKSKELEGEPLSRLVGGGVLATDAGSRSESIIPCPRRFGASFSPNGTLVVFASARVTLRVRMDKGSRQGSSSLVPGTGQEWRSRKQAAPSYPRTYENLMTCLLKDDREGSVDDGLHEPGFVPTIPWNDGGVGTSSRLPWRDHVGAGRDDNNFDLDTQSSESSSVGGDNDLNTEFGQTGSPYTVDGDERVEMDPTPDADENEARLPWAPRPNKVILLDLSPLLPGSPELAYYYTLGPWQRPPCKRDPSLQPAAVPGTHTVRETDLFSQSYTSSADEEIGFTTDVTFGNRPRRHTLLGTNIGLLGGIVAPPFLQRGVSVTMDHSGRSTVSAQRVNLDAGQSTFGKQRQWDSTPDFLAIRGRSGGLNARGAWGSVLPPGPLMTVGSPAFGGGSPGLWDTPKTVQRVCPRSASVDEIIVGSPHQYQLGWGLSDVLELPLRKPGTSVTPPRQHSLPEESPIATAGLSTGRTRGALSPGMTLGMKAPGDGRTTFRRMRSGSGGGGSKWLAGTGMRQRYPLRKNTSAGNGPSPPTEIPRVRQGFPPPSSPAITPGVAPSSSPPSDFIIEHGTAAGVPGPLFAVNMSGGDGLRGSSFSAGGGMPLGTADFVVMERSTVGQSGRTGRGYSGVWADQVPSMERPMSAPQASPGLFGAAHFGMESAQMTGTRSRSGTGIWHCSVTSGNDGSAEEAFGGLHSPSVGELCRRNAVVASKLASGGGLSRTWAGLAEAADVAAFEKLEGLTSTGVHERRRITKDILRRYEALGDTQMLATIVCVLASASLGGMGELLPEEEEHLLAYERYLTAYAELLDVWGAYQVRVSVLNHISELKHRRSELRVHTPRKQSHDISEPSPGGASEAKCSVCESKVVFMAWKCNRCGHGGHHQHIEEYFENNPGCIICGCQCRGQQGFATGANA